MHRIAPGLRSSHSSGIEPFDSRFLTRGRMCGGADRSSAKAQSKEKKQVVTYTFRAHYLSDCWLFAWFARSHHWRLFNIINNSTLSAHIVIWQLSFLPVWFRHLHLFRLSWWFGPPSLRGWVRWATVWKMGKEKLLVLLAEQNLSVVRHSRLVTRVCGRISRGREMCPN